MNKNDLKLIGVILIIAVIGFFTFKLTAKNGSTVKVIINGQTKEEYSLNEDIKTVISNGKGKNTLVIKDGFAYIESADCPDKICVSHRKISKSGETVVCLPHKVVIEVE